MKTTWDFVEKYYPNYYSCDSIAEAQDLFKIIEGSYEIGDCADKLHTGICGDVLDDPSKNVNDTNLDVLVMGEVIRRHNNLMVGIYQRSIEAFIEAENSQDIVYYLMGSEVCRSLYETDDVNKVVEFIKEEEPLFDVYAFNPHTTHSSKLVDAMDGWSMFVTINKYTYDTLKNYELKPKKAHVF